MKAKVINIEEKSRPHCMAFDGTAMALLVALHRTPFRSRFCEEHL